MLKYIVVFFVLFVAACGGSSETQSTGAWFTEYAEVYCEETAPCFEEFSIPGCISGFYSSACSGVDCSDPITVDLGEWGACLDGIGILTCEELVNGVVPRECLSIDELN